jgi:hypothetical protein
LVFDVLFELIIEQVVLLLVVASVSGPMLARR